MKRIFTLMALTAFTLSLLAQSPSLMTFQSVLRDAENHLITNQAVAIQISIMQGTPNSAAVYTEVHSVSTNANGLVSLMIGDGVTGDDFNLIDWSTGPFFLKTETDPAGGTNYTITTTSELVSVPYAQYADEAGNTFSGNYADLTGAPVNVSAFANDEGYLTSELWTRNGGDIFYSNGNVGIGTTTPGRILTLNSGGGLNYLTFQNNGTGTSGSDGFMVGNETDLDGFVWNWENGPIHFGTSNNYRMTLTGAGDLGIGTTAPDTRLDVIGDTKFGSNGIAFNEIREITGTTPASSYFTSFALPSGYTETNTRVLSFEINYLGDRWTGLGFDNGDVDRSMSYLILGTTMYIYYPDLSSFHSRAFRILIMQIAP